MRSVSADFCASAGAAVASVMQAASSVPPSQVSDRIYWSSQFRKTQTTPGTYGVGQQKQPACHRPGGLWQSDGAHLSLVYGRQQPLQETVDGLGIDPANHGH